MSAAVTARQAYASHAATAAEAAARQAYVPYARWTAYDNLAAAVAAIDYVGDVTNKLLPAFAEEIVQILDELKTPGAKFLSMTE